MTELPLSAPRMPALDTYRLLGRSGLRVSPLALGTMTFGAAWGTDERESQALFDAYVDKGGNFIDTANDYSEGRAETYVGAFAKHRRHRLVLATKYSMGFVAGDPNSGGNHRKSMVGSVEQSLARLQTDYLDILYLHAWDFTTPVEEILRGLDDLVCQGKILYIAISNTPAWQVSRMQAIAELRSWASFAALQIEYNLAQRDGERDLIPMAAEMGLGVISWSPLAMGVLTGKYRSGKAGITADPDGRGPLVSQSGRVTSAAMAIVEELRRIAQEMERTPAQVALAWTLLNPAVTAPVMGVRTLQQLVENLASLALCFSQEQKDALAAVSAIELGYPHDFISAERIQKLLRAGATVEPRR